MWLFVALAASPVAAQQDVLARARNAPSRAEGLSILATHLAETPRDVDARLLYGLMLSWEGRYDDARRELEQVLAQTPDYLDARMGLANVEWWTGRIREARAHVDQVLQREPGHPQARVLRQRLDASDRPWTLGLSAAYDRFNDGRGAWHEQFLSLSRQTPIGALVFRGSRAERFARRDEQFEIEFYPTFRPGTYAFIGVGAAPDRTLYPETRFSADLYQNIGRGFEVSGGYRRLDFGTVTNIYLATLTKYVGNWMLTGKLYHVPGAGRLDSNSGHVVARRYFGSDGTSFVGIGFSHGLNREEIRGLGDLATLDHDTLRGQVDALVHPRMRLQFDLSTSRQERAVNAPLWQTTLGAGMSFRF
jgi:YaiO family outer membrane protein